MLFNSFSFLILFLITFVVYYTPLFRRFQIAILIISSFIFYGFNSPWLTLLLVMAILINAVSSFKIKTSSEISSKKNWATIGVGLNLATLLFFKYNRIIADLIYHDWSKNSGVGQFILSIPLPIGISFFTFQGISLAIDVYKQENKTLKIEKSHIVEVNTIWNHLYKTCFFKAFFPQLIAGPIVKAHDFYYQIAEKNFRDIHFEKVIKYLIAGYFLKMVIADNLKDQTFWISYPYFEVKSSIELVVMLFGYSMQIFADFAGYSYIAIGLACAFGYELKENFEFPYISYSFSEFWRRWHISLSTFLKEYLYIPLGGNKKGEFRTYLNLFIVMFLGGLWHGATWSYAVWGTFHGLLLAIERKLGGADIINHKSLKHAPRMIFTFIMVSFAWLLFKLPNFTEALLYLKCIQKNIHIPMNKSIIFFIIIYSIPVITFHLNHLAGCNLKYRKFILKFDWVIYTLLLFFIIFNSGAGGEFIYFQF